MACRWQLGQFEVTLEACVSASGERPRLVEELDVACRSERRGVDAVIQLVLEDLGVVAEAGRSR